jgi:hypothetical protein
MKIIKRYWWFSVFALATLLALILPVIYPMPSGAQTYNPLIEYVNITHVETVYVPVEVVKPVPDCIPFKSKDELQEYVRGVLQSHIILKGVCVDYAEMLHETAYYEHRDIGIYGIYVMNENGEMIIHHWLNFAEVDNHIYQIEPQTGVIAMLQGWGEMRVRIP